MFWHRLFRLYCHTNTGSNRLLTAGRQQQLPRGSRGDEKKHSNRAKPSWAKPKPCQVCGEKKPCCVVSFSHAEWHLILWFALLTADGLFGFLKPVICWIFQTETVIKFNTWGLINLWLPSGYYFLHPAAMLHIKSVSFLHTISVSSSGLHCSVHSSLQRPLLGGSRHPGVAYTGNEVFVNQNRSASSLKEVGVGGSLWAKTVSNSFSYSGICMMSQRGCP